MPNSLVWEVGTQANGLKVTFSYVEFHTKLKKEKLSHEKIREIIDLIPDDWLLEEAVSDAHQERRDVYFDFIKSKLSNINLLVQEARDGR